MGPCLDRSAVAEGRKLRGEEGAGRPGDGIDRVPTISIGSGGVTRGFDLHRQKLGLPRRRTSRLSCISS